MYIGSITYLPSGRKIGVVKINYDFFRGRNKEMHGYDSFDFIKLNL